MANVAQHQITPEAVDHTEATLNYIVSDGSKIFTVTADPGGTDVRSGGTLDPRKVAIHSGRNQDFVLDRDGFRFVRHDTRVTDFFDDEQIKRIYYPEMEALVKAESGARRVVVFDHTLRTADDEERKVRKIREVVPRVHNDYTEWSGPKRVRDLLPDELGKLGARVDAVEAYQTVMPEADGEGPFVYFLCEDLSRAPGPVDVPSAVVALNPTAAPKTSAPAPRTCATREDPRGRDDRQHAGRESPHRCTISSARRRMSVVWCPPAVLSCPVHRSNRRIEGGL